MGFRKKQHSQIVRTGSSGGKRKVVISALIVILFIGVNTGLFLWQQRIIKEAKRAEDQQRTEKSALEEKVKTLESRIAAAEDDKTETQKAEEETLNNASVVQGAFIHQDYTALQPHLAAQVMVILAASEGVGSRTPEQVPGDLAVLSSATAPWNFTVSEETLAEWRTGDYKQYFPEGAIVGRSANNYVIALQQNAAGKVTTIFISPDATLL